MIWIGGILQLLKPWPGYDFGFWSGAKNSLNWPLKKHRETIGKTVIYNKAEGYMFEWIYEIYIPCGQANLELSYAFYKY